MPPLRRPYPPSPVSSQGKPAGISSLGMLVSPDGTALPWRLVAIFIFLAAGIGILGWWSYSAEVAYLRQREYGQLQAVSHFKAAQVADWLAERRWDAKLVFGSALSQRDFALWLTGSDLQAGERLTARLQSLLVNSNYLGLELSDPTGGRQLVVGTTRHSLSQVSPALLATAERSTEPQLVDLDRHGSDGTIQLAYLMPITDPERKTPPLGFLLITIDPGRTLYPLVQSWPTPSPSAETLIVRRDGDDVLFLNELRHVAGTALRLRLPLGQRDLPAARAALGYDGIFEGKDYRGIEVISYLQSIPGTPWRMVTKVDRAEVFGDIRQTGLKTLLAALLLLLLAATLLLMSWRRQQMMARLQLRQELERVADLSPGVIHSFTLRSDGSAVFLYASPAIRDVFGFGSEQLLLNATLATARIHPDDLQSMVAGLQVSARDLSPWLFEYRYRHPDKGEIWLEEKSVPTRLSDGTTAWHGFITDVTDRKRGQLALEAQRSQLEVEVAARTAELVAANKELQAFAYAVSHDLKAPLRVVNGLATLLARDCRDRLGADELEYVDRICHSAARMTALIDDLLSYARVEQHIGELSAVDLRGPISSVLAERREEIRLHGVDVQVALPAALVRANPHGLAQVLRNLVDNALKYSAKSPHPRLEIGSEAHGNRCRLWVRDNGIGFDMALHDRIFDIFRRLHTEQEFPGTGIGLALVKKAMERMGGRVWAESSPGQGATFYLEFADAGPAAVAESGEHTYGQEQGPAEKPIKID